MAFVERIFYRKINPSDFKKMYDIDKPASGGGQTYIEAAGIANEAIYDFFEYAVSTPWTGDPNRKTFKANVFVLGTDEQQELEFEPRAGRNYKISRQNLRHKHKAWSPENGFPVPRIVDNHYSNDFTGIIENLIIFIIRTSDRNYYAGFVNSENLPSEWPGHVGLEQIFEGKRRGILVSEQDSIFFENNKDAPFATDDFFPNFELNIDENGQPDKLMEVLDDFSDDFAVREAPHYETQEEIDESDSGLPVLRPGSSNNTRFSTDPKKAKTVLVNSNWTCALDGFDGRDHTTFDTKSGNKYLEAHHLVPMKAQKDYYPIKLDVYDNIIPLCPNCHRAVHNGSIEEKKRYLRPLYDARIEKLKEHNIDISFDDLISKYYK